MTTGDISTVAQATAVVDGVLENFSDLRSLDVRTDLIVNILLLDLKDTVEDTITQVVQTLALANSNPEQVKVWHVL